MLLVSLGWQQPANADDDPKTILMIAGNPSHGFGAHEHYAGLRVLADTLSSLGDDLKIHVVRGWPEDAKLIESADSIVIFSDGGPRHLALPQLDTLAKKLDQGCGFVCLHYAVEVPLGEPGQAWLKYLGGYFETDWSVNPHWRAEFKSLPDHPVTQGVEPFAMQDEWYFHMRFTETPGVTPILQAVAPESTMRRPDGHHSGNPAARKSVAAGDPQTVAWTYERADGGRSFGFTGGHFHWNWGHPHVRRLVSNAILWTAGGEIPSGGVGAERLGVDELLEHQDFPKPDNFDAEATAREYQLSRLDGNAELPTLVSAPADAKQTPKLLYVSPLVTTQIGRHAIDIDADLQGSRELFLVVTDGGDGYACDWANWIDPVLVKKKRTLSCRY